MSFIQHLTRKALPVDSRLSPLVGWIASCATTIPGRIAARLLPRGQREGPVIGLAGAVMVLVVTAFTSLILREIDVASHTSSQEHVEQLLNSVTYQLDTTLVMVDQALRHTGEEILEYDSPQKLVELAADGRVPTHLLGGFFFINPQGRVVASVRAKDNASGSIDLSDREYFRIQLDSLSVESRIGQPLRGRVTGKELLPVSRPLRRSNGELMGVLVAMIDIQALERIWLNIGFRPDDSIGLMGKDNKVWFSWPHRAAADSVAEDGMSWSRHITGWPMTVVARLHQATVDRHSLAARRVVVVSAVAGSLSLGGSGLTDDRPVLRSARQPRAPGRSRARCRRGYADTHDCGAQRGAGGIHRIRPRTTTDPGQPGSARCQPLAHTGCGIGQNDRWRDGELHHTFPD